MLPRVLAFFDADATAAGILGYMTELKYPHIRVEGSARQRGQQYGAQARDRVRRSIDAYRQIFEDLGSNWDEVLFTAQSFEPTLERYNARYLDEMQGIAEGAELPYEHVLAINIRTEIISPATAKANLAECSAVAILPEVTSDGHTLIGQNWDNLPHTAETVVVLEAIQDDGPNFVTVVEAGLLAKTGFNSFGIGVTTNALITDRDHGDADGVPLHAILRGILDSESLDEGVDAIAGQKRASSSNYLIADVQGSAIDIETQPGDSSNYYTLEPENGILLHTNHYVAPLFDGVDVLRSNAPDSMSRLQRLSAQLREAGGELEVKDVQRVLSDHEHYPKSVCCHPDPKADTPSGRSTASVIMDLDRQILWLAEGNPCIAPYHEFDYSGLMGSTSSQTAGV